MAKLIYHYGTMSSGKSGILLMQAHQFEESGIPFLCMKSAIDTRDGEDVIVSRIGIKRECITVGVEDDLYALMTSLIGDFTLQGLSKPCWILVDEAQFLSAKQVEQLGLVVDRLNINVMCYGLRTDFLSRMFEGSKRLMELADEIDEIKTSCSCGRKAVVNARFHNGEITTEGEQIMIGGNETYIPLCRKCYFEALERERIM